MGSTRLLRIIMNHYYWHYLSNAGVPQKWRICWQMMMVLGTNKRMRPHWTSSVRQVVPPNPDMIDYVIL